MDGLGVAKERGRRRAVINAAVNLRVPENVGNSLTNLNRLVSQEGLCSME
jgi:hypothetical protein